LVVNVVLLLVAEFLLRLVGAQAVSLIPPTCVVAVRLASGLGSETGVVGVVALHSRVVLMVGLVLLEVSRLIVVLIR